MKIQKVISENYRATVQHKACKSLKELTVAMNYRATVQHKACKSLKELTVAR